VDTGTLFWLARLISTAQTQANYNYRESIRRMLDNEQVRLIINLDDLRDYDRSYADGCVTEGVFVRGASGRSDLSGADRTVQIAASADRLPARARYGTVAARPGAA
jgi:hypothetical protein